MATETIPINRYRDRVREGLPFDLRVTEITAWPDQELYFHFEFNELMDRWLFEIHHVDGQTLVAPSVATLGKEYSAWPYCLFKFSAVEGKHNSIHRGNLGDEVVLGIYPGPAGGSFLPEAGISKRREDEILRRRQYYPHMSRRTIRQVKEEVVAMGDG